MLLRECRESRAFNKIKSFPYPARHSHKGKKDSREALTDAEAPPTEKLDFLSDPKNPPGTAKRAASSPVETKDLKKPKTKESSKNKYNIPGRQVNYTLQI